MTWRRTAFLLLLLAALTHGPARADGGFFKGRSALDRELAEPDQKALLFRDAQRETLILQVKYVGEVSDFGWVVPVPGRPKIDTASSELFYELAALTMPAQERKAGGGRGGAMGGGGGGGVTVLEEIQVGPYDATVLAASDAKALGEWLSRHGYNVPRGIADVLAPYVERRWYYVALRVNVKKDVLKWLREIDPRARSAQQAPEQLATDFIRLVDSRPDAAKEKLEALESVYARATGRTPGKRGSRFDFMSGANLPATYRRYREVLRNLSAGLISDERMTECLSRCGGGTASREFLLAARRVGLYDGEAGVELTRAFSRAMYEDMARDIPYRRSRIGRFHARLRERRQGPEDRVARFEQAYETTRWLLRESRLAQPSMMAMNHLRESAQSVRQPPLVMEAALKSITVRTSLYLAVYGTARGAVTAAENALRGGTIAPLRLEFDTPRLVYPLRMSSLNPGRTDVQLYVLSDGVVTASGFRVDFAGNVDQIDRQRFPELSAFVTGRRMWLTKLRATMSSGDMLADVEF
jgi:hypothetical protein